MKHLLATAALAVIVAPVIAQAQGTAGGEDCPPGFVHAADAAHAETGQRGYTDPGDGERTVGAASRDHAETGQRGYTDPGDGERTVGGGGGCVAMPDTQR